MFVYFTRSQLERTASVTDRANLSASLAVSGQAASRAYHLLCHPFRRTPMACSKVASLNGLAVEFMRVISTEFPNFDVELLKKTRDRLHGKLGGRSMSWK